MMFEPEKRGYSLEVLEFSYGVATWGSRKSSRACLVVASLLTCSHWLIPMSQYFLRLSLDCPSRDSLAHFHVHEMNVTIPTELKKNLLLFYLSIPTLSGTSSTPSFSKPPQIYQVFKMSFTSKAPRPSSLPALSLRQSQISWSSSNKRKFQDFDFANWLQCVLTSNVVALQSWKVS